MKKYVMLVLMSAFLSVNAHADLGQNKGPKVDCSKVIQSIQEQMKRSRPAGEAPVSGTPDAPTGAGTAQ